MNPGKIAIWVAFSMIFLIVFIAYTQTNYTHGKGILDNSLNALFGFKDFEPTVDDFDKGEGDKSSWESLELQSDAGAIRSLFCDETHCYLGRYSGIIEKINKQNGHSVWKRELGKNSAPYGETDDSTIADTVYCDVFFCYTGYNENDQNHKQRLAKINRNGDIFWGSTIVPDETRKLEDEGKTVISDMECKGDYCYIVTSYNAKPTVWHELGDTYFYEEETGYVARVNSNGEDKKITKLRWANGNELYDYVNVMDIDCDYSKHSADSCFMTSNQLKRDIPGSWTMNMPNAYITKARLSQLDSSNNPQLTVRLCDQSNILSKWCAQQSQDRFGPVNLYRGNYAVKTICDNNDDSTHGYCYTLVNVIECKSNSNGHCISGMLADKRSFVVKFAKSTLSVIQLYPTTDTGIGDIGKDLWCDRATGKDECFVVTNNAIVMVGETDLTEVKSYPEQPNLDKIECDTESCYISGSVVTKVTEPSGYTYYDINPYFKGTLRSELSE